MLNAFPQVGERLRQEVLTLRTKLKEHEGSGCKVRTLLSLGACFFTLLFCRWTAPFWRLRKTDLIQPASERSKSKCELLLIPRPSTPPSPSSPPPSPPLQIDCSALEGHKTGRDWKS